MNTSLRNSFRFSCFLCLFLFAGSALAQECSDEELDSTLICLQDSFASCAADTGCTSSDTDLEIATDYIDNVLVNRCCGKPTAKKIKNCLKNLRSQLNSKTGRKIMPLELRNALKDEVAEKLSEVDELGECPSETA